MTEKKKAVDLSSFDEAKKKHEEGIEVPIAGPDGKTKMGFSIKVAGPDSERAEAAQGEMIDALAEKQNETHLDRRERVTAGILYLAKITLGWEPNIIVDGEELAYSEANAEKLYRRHKFIREQVNVAAGNRARFTNG